MAVDIDQPVENPDLVSAIRQLLGEQNARHEAHFIEELKKAHFLAPVIIDPMPQSADESGKIVLKEKTRIGFQKVVNNKDQNFFPLFTDWDELKKWNNAPNQQTLIVTFTDVSAMVLGDNDTSSGAIINPYGQSLLLEKTRIARLNGKSIPYSVQKETTVQLGEPKEYPQTLVDALKQHLKTVKEVKKAYLMLMIKDNEQSFLIVVDFKGDHRKVFDGIAAAAAPHLKADQLIDMVPADQRFGQDAINGKKPFYSKGILGF